MEIKPVLQSKTMWFGFAVAALSILEAACGFLDEFLSPQYAALAVAIVGGIIMVLRVVTGMPIKRAKTKVPPVLPMVLVLALGVSGCAMTPAQRLATVATSVNALHASAAPAWSSVCKGKAEKCVTDGVAASKDCGPWVSCQSALKRYYEAHLVLQRGIQTAAWHLINDNLEAAQRVLATVTAGLAAAYELAKAEGAIQ